MIQIYSGLMLWGLDIDPEAVTLATRLHPQTIHRRGDLMPNGTPREAGSWWFTTKDLLCASIAASLDDLFTRLTPAWPVLVDLSAGSTCAIECYVKVYDRAPEASAILGFEARHVRRAAELGAYLGIDYYDFRGSGVEPE